MKKDQKAKRAAYRALLARQERERKARLAAAGRPPAGLFGDTPDPFLVPLGQPIPCPECGEPVPYPAGLDAKMATCKCGWMGVTVPIPMPAGPSTPPQVACQIRPEDDLGSIPPYCGKCGTRDVRRVGDDDELAFYCRKCHVVTLILLPGMDPPPGVAVPWDKSPN